MTRAMQNLHVASVNEFELVHTVSKCAVPGGYDDFVLDRTFRNAMSSYADIAGWRCGISIRPIGSPERDGTITSACGSERSREEGAL